MCTQLLPSSFRQTLMKIIDMDKNFPFYFALCSFFYFTFFQFTKTEKSGATKNYFSKEFFWAALWLFRANIHTLTAPVLSILGHYQLLLIIDAKFLNAAWLERIDFSRADVAENFRSRSALFCFPRRLSVFIMIMVICDRNWSDFCAKPRTLMRR